MSEPQSSIAPSGASAGWTKPLPLIDQWNRPFWEATTNNQLVLQRDAHGNHWFPPSPVSPFDIAASWDWVAVSGHGTVVSWVVFHQKYFAGFADELPYAVVLVQLDEGPRLFSSLPGVAHDQIKIGMKVSVDFLPATDSLSIPVFRPAERGQP